MGGAVHARARTAERTTRGTSGRRPEPVRADRGDGQPETQGYVLVAARNHRRVGPVGGGMGFTIGSSRGIREIRTGTRRRGRSSECTAVAEYTGLWGWDVAAGARAAGGACSCGLTDCPAPGAHPLSFAPRVAAGATLDEVTDTWGQFPGAAVMLPVGRAFDVIEVAEPAGRRALVRLERMGLPSARSPPPRRAAPSSSSPPAPPPNSPNSSTAWAGTTRPSTCTAWAPVRTSRHPLRPGRPRPGHLAAPARPGHGDQASGGQAAAGDAGLRGAPVAGVAPESTARGRTARRPSPTAPWGRAPLRGPTDFRRR